MELENIIKAIKNEIIKDKETFFSYAWREKLGELGAFLEQESKYSKLVDWINEQIEQCNEIKNIFCPADKQENTTVGMVNTYLEVMQKIAVLIHCKEILLDNRTTIKMRENIEYTLCKLYNIYYSEDFDCYL